MKTTIRSLLILGVLIFSVPFCLLAGVPPKPSPPRLVNDFAAMLTQEEASLLEQKLVAFNDSTSTQITVVTITSLDGYDIDDLAQRIGQEWKVGQKEFDNGIVILIKPKNGNEKGLAAISTGYGMEDIIPDAIARRIVDNEMIPFFKQNQNYSGIDAGVNIIMDLASGKYKADKYAKKKSRPLGLIVPVIIIIIIAMLFGRNGNNRHHNIGRNSGLPFWLLLSMMGNSGRGSGGDWGGFSGGGGGGGFGGFGGGGFGGGGASGSW
ncbi:MAG: TPM domain-containing protein [Bacteroidales bacterium]|nr:TPM domain-containing protein [Bacteroidales bacterium]MBK9357317.1 TPM domain-containing protein [Bacteroidales bacterium]